MAEYLGELKDFEKFIGPRLRNIVQTSISRKYKRELGKCEGENCTNTEKLEAAHVHGKGRKELLKIAYDKNSNENRIDLKKFEEDFIQLHYPLSESFKILCKSCHNIYDKITEEITLIENEEDSFDSDENKYATLEIEFYPDDITEFKELLLQYKSAYINISYTNGTTKTKEWNTSRFSETSDVIRNLRSRPEFRQGNWQQEKIEKVLVEINY